MKNQIYKFILVPTIPKNEIGTIGLVFKLVLIEKFILNRLVKEMSKPTPVKNPTSSEVTKSFWSVRYPVELPLIYKSGLSVKRLLTFRGIV